MTINNRSGDCRKVQSNAISLCLTNSIADIKELSYINTKRMIFASTQDSFIVLQYHEAIKQQLLLSARCAL